MAHYLPPPLLALFTPRPPLEYKPPVDLSRKRPRAYTGLASYLNKFKDPSTLKPLEKNENAKEKKERRKIRRMKRGDNQTAVHLKKWDPQKNESATEDAYRTLFVARMDYKVSEEDLRTEMEKCGPVKKVRIVKDSKTDKPRGYAFVEFEDARDFKYAYKNMDGRRIGNRPVLIDVERGRTVPNWKPRSLGGGLGTTRKGDKKKKKGDRDVPSSRPRERDAGRRDSGAVSRDRPAPRMETSRRDDRDRSSYRDRDRDRFRDRERPRDFNRERRSYEDSRSGRSGHRDSYGGRDRRPRDDGGRDRYSRR